MDPDGHQLDEGETCAAADDAEDHDERLTSRERTVLLDGSGLSRTAELATRLNSSAELDRLWAEDAAGERAKLLAASATQTEVAELLGEPVSSVMARTAEDGLVSFYLEGRERYPLWQFHDRKPLPGLSEVVAALPRTWRARKVMAVMAAPTEMLDGKSPPRWLAEAGDPTAVVDVLEGLSRG